MQYGKYSFRCRFETGAILPAFKGSTFRGVFGIALKRVVCALKQQECAECLLRNRCLYVKVFETSLALKPPEGSRVSDPPHPFVIEPPETEKREYEKGDTIECGLALFGDINSHLPYFVYAFEQMGKIGLGKGVRRRHGRFVLEEVKKGDLTVYSEKDRKLALPAETEELSLSRELGPSRPKIMIRRRKKIVLPARRPAVPEQGNLRLKVRLVTPLRLKFENRIRADLPFHVLVRAMLRRVSSLMNIWGGGEPAIDYRELVERAGKVRITDNSLRWFDWKRYSNRQERKMFMGGMLGSVTYGGDLGEYLGLLDFCQKVHVGKNTSFGLGKIRATRE